MAGILYVHAGAAHARDVFAHQRRAYWAAAFPVVLEKHGFLTFEVAGPEALEDERRLQSADAVLVASLPAAAWTPAAAELVVRCGTPVLLEPPLPGPLRAHLGVTPEGEAGDEGGIVPVDTALREAATAYGVAPGAPLTPSSSDSLDRDPDLDWTRIPRVPIDDAQAEAWRAPGWTVERWSVGSRSAVLCDWVQRAAPHARLPAVVRHGAVTAASFEMFGFLAQRHTIEPFDGPEWRKSDRSIGLEAVLLALLDDMHRRKGAVRVRVLPWPAGRRWARTVRHEVLAPLPEDAATEVERWNETATTRATVYWASAVDQPAVARRLAACPALEVALAAERLWAAAPGEERRALELQTEQPVGGAASRGSSHCFRHQGAPNVLWAEDEGFDYTELTGRAHAHPHRFPTLDADGTVRVLDILCLPPPESVRRLVLQPERLRATLGWWRDAGGYCQLGAPIQRFGKRAAGRLAAALDDEGWDATTAEAMAWWRRSHIDLSLAAVGDGRFELRSPTGVQDLGLEVLQPDGSRSVETVSVGGDPLRLHFPPAERPTLVSWDETRPLFRDALRDAYGAAGDADAPVVEAQIHATATSRERGETVLKALAELGGLERLDGARVLDAGCGFGGLSIYLGWRARPEAVLGVDTSLTNLAVGRAVAQAAGLRDVGFSYGDLVSLPLEDGAVDVALAIGVLMYMPSPGRLQRALRELRRVTAPGGLVYIYQATRWQWRDPMSGRPVVHLLPRWAARHVDPNPHTRTKRWISPLELAVQLRLAGFRHVRLESFGGHGTRRRGLRRLRDPYYAVCASVPGSRATDTVRRSPLPIEEAEHGSAQNLVHEWGAVEAKLSAGIAEAVRTGRRGMSPAERRVRLRANTALAPERARVLLECSAALLGMPTVRGRRVLQVAAGFGGLAAHLAAVTDAAEVIAADADADAVEVGRSAVRGSALEPRMRFVCAPPDDLGTAGEDPVDLVLFAGRWQQLDEDDGFAAAVAGIRAVLRVPDGAALFYGRVANRDDRAASRAVERELRRQGFRIAGERRFRDAPGELTPPRRGPTFYAIAAWRGDVA